MGNFDDIADFRAQFATLRQNVADLAVKAGALEAPRYVGTLGEPAFQNSWVNVDSPPGPTGRAAFFYRHAGRVYFGGVIKGGADGTTAFTLPSGYAPILRTPHPEILPVVAAGGIAELTVTITGDVSLTNFTAGANVNSFVFLSGSFRHI